MPLDDLAAQARRALAELPVTDLVTAGELVDEVATQTAHLTAGGGAERDEILQTIGTGREALDRAIHRMTEAGEAISTYLDEITGGQGAAAPGPRLAPSSSWGTATQRSLPQWSGGPTAGIWRLSNGTERPVTSGAEADGTDVRLAAFMVERGLVPSYMRQPEGAKHVELKTAFRMRESVVSHSELAINKEIDTDMYGCDRLLPFVLKPGQTLVVHHPKGSTTYRGAG